MAYIQCEDLILGYEGTPVAQHINFSVAQGDYLCIVGENGAGKSTLMKTLLGLTPLMGGRIVYGDGLEAHAIGYLPQQTFVQKDFRPPCGRLCCLEHFHSAGGALFFRRNKNSLRRKICVAWIFGI